MNKRHNRYFKICPKTGLIVGIRNKYFDYKWLILFIGVFSLLWYLIRVLPKPSRASYPCMQVAAPFAFTFIGFLSTAFLSVFGMKKVFYYFKTNRIALAVLFVVLTTAGILTNIAFQRKIVFAETLIATGKFVPIDKPNTPMGVPDNIFPGRVTWVHDSAATNWDGTSNYWWSAKNNNQQVISEMMIKAINNISGGSTISESWDLLFKNLNKKKGKGNIGYKAGEKIVIKINLNSNGASNFLDASPQTVYAILDELVNSVGVTETDICVYDAIRNNGMTAVRNYCITKFPNVSYQNWGTWVANAIKYSSTEITGTDCRRFPSKVVAADYMVNLALLKRHSRYSDNWVDGDGQTAVTLCGKNHFGTCGAPMELHAAIQDWRKGMGTYNPIVDLMGSKYLGGNTVLYILDGLYCSSLHEIIPVKWKIPPFNNDWPSSIFVSLDQVALESVGLDFLNAEWGLIANADNYLHEAALANNPPSKTIYNPDGITLKSLGVHEHWNNATDKQYSRNLGLNTGIELYKIEDQPSLCSKPNLGPDQTICGKNNIILNAGLKTIINKTLAWYKDNVLISGQSGATLTITQAGIYRLDVDSAGCKTTDNIIINGSLSVNLGVDKVLCNPAVQTLDAGNTNANFIWSTGATTQTITVSKPGTYTVSVSATNCASVSDAIIVTSKLLNVTADTICSSGVINLTATGGLFNWYDVASGGSPLSTGASSFSPTITANKTYYVEDTGGFEGSLGKTDVGTGATWNLGAGDVAGTDKINKVSVLKALTLKSIAVYVTSANSSVTINFIQGTTTVKTKTFSGLAVGKQTLALNFDLVPDDYIVNAVGTTGSIGFEASGAAFPYSYNSYISFTYNENWQSGWYGSFYDWKISAGNPCQRTPVYAVIDNTNTNCVTAIEEKSLSSVISIYPNPSSDWLTVNSYQSIVHDIKIIDLFERIVYQSNESFVGLKTIDTKGLSSGLYFLFLQGENVKYIKKIIIE